MFWPPNDLAALVYFLLINCALQDLAQCNNESSVGTNDTCTIKVKTIFAQKLDNSSREVPVYKIMDFYLGIA